jgi:phosphoribosylglycinamide formyltransferase-1
MKQIAIFASGAGSNAEKIIQYFSEKHSSGNATIALILSNKPDAGVLQIAAANNIPSLVIEKEKFFRGNSYVDELRAAKIDLIVLAGFLWKIPLLLINSFQEKIINIHPALLPSYGGKGMYGKYVHEAVIANQEKESGISVHFVDAQYDHGKIIFQSRCPVLENDSAESLAQRIHKLEHEHFPKVIEKILAEQDAAI